jgi:hypothetical protein
LGCWGFPRVINNFQGVEEVEDVEEVEEVEDFKKLSSWKEGWIQTDAAKPQSVWRRGGGNFKILPPCIKP